MPAAVLPVVRAISRDKSWRVRYVVAEHFCALVERLGVDVTRVEMVPTYVALLQDGEAEVRTAAAFNSASFAAMLLAETVLTHLLPCYRDLSSDSSPHVRGLFTCDFPCHSRSTHRLILHSLLGLFRYALLWLPS